VHLRQSDSQGCLKVALWLISAEMPGVGFRAGKSL
jgi:hypothetical protein